MIQFFRFRPISSPSPRPANLIFFSHNDVFYFVFSQLNHVYFQCFFLVAIFLVSSPFYSPPAPATILLWWISFTENKQQRRNIVWSDGTTFWSPRKWDRVGRVGSGWGGWGCEVGWGWEGGLAGRVWERRSRRVVAAAAWHTSLPPAQRRGLVFDVIAAVTLFFKYNTQRVTRRQFLLYSLLSLLSALPRLLRLSCR